MSILSPLKADCIVFDIDGVLMDTSSSFPKVIGRAIPIIWEKLLGHAKEESPFSKRHFDTSKQFPGLNDDYDLCWAITTFTASKGIDSLTEAFPSPWEWGELLTEMGNSPTIPWFKDRFGDLVPYEKTREVCEEIYFGEEKTRDLLKRDPLYSAGPGLWKEEKPLLSKSWKDISLPCAIYTGRSRKELKLALEALQWEDFPHDYTICSDDDIRKPSPEGLHLICKRLGKEWPLFFGDTASDMATIKAFKRGDFVAIGTTLRNVEFRFLNIEDAIRALGL